MLGFTSESLFLPGMLTNMYHIIMINKDLTKSGTQLRNWTELVARQLYAALVDLYIFMQDLKEIKTSEFLPGEYISLLELS